MAALANDDCTQARPLALPAEVDTLVVERSTEEGWTLVDRVDPTGPSQLVTGIDEGDALLRVIACVDRAPVYAARPARTPIDEAGKSGLALHFKPVGRLACTGTTLPGPSYNRYAGLGRPRAFAAAARLDDGRVFVAGGADAVADGRLSVDEADLGWDVYSPSESLFLPGVDRAQPLVPRPLIAPRLAARALPWTAPGAERPGVLVLGGVPAMVHGNHPFGPLAPEGAQVSRPAAEYFDPSDGSVAPVVFVDGAALAERFMPAAAVDEAGRAVLVGGVEWPGGAASDVVEIIDGDRLRTLRLPPAPEREGELARNGLVGATAVPVGDGRFFVWGGDLNGCGQRPGWLLSLDPTPRIEPLAIVHAEPPPTCGQPPGCRPWYSTAYHAAARLESAGTRPRVLVTGGVVIGERRVINNPEPGEACDANAFVAEVDPTALTATLYPIPAGFDVGGRLKRALHTATPAGGGRVLIAGGWAFLGNANLLRSADDVLFYRDARPVGTVDVAPDRLSSPRLGGLAVPLDGGAVLLGGGLSRPAADEPFAVSAAAEVYTPPIDTPVCAEGG